MKNLIIIAVYIRNTYSNSNYPIPADKFSEIFQNVRKMEMGYSNENFNVKFIPIPAEETKIECVYPVVENVKINKFFRKELINYIKTIKDKEDKKYYNWFLRIFKLNRLYGY